MALFRTGLTVLLAAFASQAYAQARFDLVGPKIEVRVSRNGVDLPIASVPNLQPGDRIWLHPDLPASQSVHYLLIATFLRGTTNPPPDEWFTRIETWNRKVQEEGVTVTVPAEAQQAVLFLAPETGGDFSTLRSAVKGRPGVFVRASQDLTEAGFEQSRINTYLASMKQVPPSDPAALLEHSNLLARTLNLKPNADCFKRPIDQQYNCLTQTGTQTLLDDGHGQTIVDALSTGNGSDFINQASYTRLGGGGNYSAYVGAIVDLVRLTSGLHTAQYQYIPAIAAPTASALNLSLNTPPSFHNPKSVIVIGLPSIQKAVPPPLRPPDPSHISCLLNPKLVLPVEGAPLVFTTGFAHDLRLHLNLPAGTALPGRTETDLPVKADAFQGGLVLAGDPGPRHELPIPTGIPTLQPNGSEKPASSGPLPAPAEPITGTIEGMWGFDHFTGPTLTLQGTPGTGWHIVDEKSSQVLIAGEPNHLTLSSTATACVDSIVLQPPDGPEETLTWKLEPPPGTPAPAKTDAAKPSGEKPGTPSTVVQTQPQVAAEATAAPSFRPIELTMNLQKQEKPGEVKLRILQFGQTAPESVGTRTFSEPAQLSSLQYHANDLTLELQGKGLEQVKQLTLDQSTFLPESNAADAAPGTLLLRTTAAPKAKPGEELHARIELRDGRVLNLNGMTLPIRPVVTVLSRRILGLQASPFSLSSAPGTTPELPLGAQLLFFLKSATPFPRTGSLEIAGPDETMHKTLTLKDGLIMQDSHTLLATIDPLKLFGPSTYGLFRVRAILPDPKPDGTAGEWTPLANVVRLPSLDALVCPADPTVPCQLSGQALYLISAVSATTDFTGSTAVPEGFVDPALSVPRPSGNTFYLRLRDDPTQTVQVNMPAVMEPVPKGKPASVTSPTAVHPAPSR